MSQAGHLLTTKHQKRPAMIAGQRFGRLVGIEFVDFVGNSVSRWRFRCDCGQELVAKLITVRRGDTKSCGCWKIDRIAAVGHNNATHKMAGTPEYNTWAKIIRRCTNPKDGNFPEYGGRGITVCDEWLQSFENFFADMGRKPSPKHSIDRIDNKGNYEPGNCRWATHSQQQRNRSINRIITFRGRDMSLAEACELSNVSQRTAWKRLKRGWSIERTFTP